MGREFLGLEEHIDASVILPYLKSSYKDKLSQIEKKMVRSVKYLSDSLRNGDKYSYLIPNTYLKGTKHLVATIAMKDVELYESYQPYSTAYVTLQVDRVEEVDQDFFSHKFKLETAQDFNESFEKFMLMPKFVVDEGKYSRVQITLNHLESILKLYSDNLPKEELSKIDLSLFKNVSLADLEQIELGEKTKELLKSYTLNLVN